VVDRISHISIHEYQVFLLGISEPVKDRMSFTPIFRQDDDFGVIEKAKSFAKSNAGSIFRPVIHDHHPYAWVFTNYFLQGFRDLLDKTAFIINRKNEPRPGKRLHKAKFSPKEKTRQ
jgi:hypothetical protein